MVDPSLTGLRVARELDRIGGPRGYPNVKLTLNAILAWQPRRGV